MSEIIYECVNEKRVEQGIKIFFVSNINLTVSVKDSYSFSEIIHDFLINPGGQFYEAKKIKVFQGGISD